MRVLHLRNCRGIETLTGPETYLRDLAKNWAGGGEVEMKLIVATRAEGGSQIFADALRETGADFQLVPVTSAVSRADYLAARDELRRGSYDVLHTHDYRSDAIGWALHRKFGIPWAAFAHGWVNWSTPFSKDRLYAWIEEKAVNAADRIVVASASMHQQLLEKGFPAGKISRVNYGIDTVRFQPRPPEKIRSEFKIADGAPLIGIVGRLHPWKGHTFFLQAAAELIAEFPDARFLIVGDAAFESHRDFRSELIAEIAKLGLSERVILTGSRSDIPDVMSALDLFVIASLVEPFGLVSIEAQACGTPSIGTRVDGIPETMSEGETGLLVPPGDAKALAEAIRGLLRDRQQLLKMSQRGPSWVAENYSDQAMAKNTEALYRSMIPPAKP